MSIIKNNQHSNTHYDIIEKEITQKSKNCKKRKYILSQGFRTLILEETCVKEENGKKIYRVIDYKNTTPTYDNDLLSLTPIEQKSLKSFS